MFPGAYLLAIVVSGAGIALLDRRFRLALWAPRARRQTLVAVAIGTIVLLIADVIAIGLGVFVQGGAAGDSPLYLGVSLAPELPLEELFFLTFLSYLSVVTWSAALRLGTRPRRVPTEREGDSA